MTHYFTGKPCKRGHLANRLLSDRSCLECNKEKRARYYKENPEKFRQMRREAYATNPDKEREVAKIRSREWRKLNPGHRNALKSKYLADRAQRIPAWANMPELIAFYKNCPKGFHVDHVYPLRGKYVSGLHVLENLQYLPAVENMRKNNRYIPA
jgi:hypothetical protein